jgi:signal transduction histidine kinase
MSSPSRTKNYSLQVRLFFRVFTILMAVLGLFTAFVVFRANEVSNTINERALESRAEELADSVVRGEESQFYQNLSPELKRMFSASQRNHVYFLRDLDGTLIAASHPEMETLGREWPGGEEPNPFVEINGVFRPDDVFYGIAKVERARTGGVFVLVAQSGDESDFADYVLFEFLTDVSWLGPLMIVLIGLTVVFTLRQGFRVLSGVSKVVGTINARTTSVRLETSGLPVEIAPFVETVNQALRRLEEGFVAERRFTANAAHELRTPLTILKARIDALKRNPKSGAIQDLGRDVDRMARVVTQLLAAARLEIPDRRQTGPADFSAALKEVVKDLAPLSLKKGQDITTRFPAGPVLVDCDYAGLTDAAQNLVENAIAHCPSKTRILVELLPAGVLRVSDNGPGISSTDKHLVFERFFRRSTAATDIEGAGLGLAIVREFALKSGGTVQVEDTPGGGTTFVLALPLSKTGAGVPPLP